MPEIFNMVTIIGKYLVKKQITILESLCMYGDNSNAWFETAVFGKDALRISNAGNDGICSINEVIDVFTSSKRTLLWHWNSSMNWGTCVL